MTSINVAITSNDFILLRIATIKCEIYITVYYEREGKCYVIQFLLHTVEIPGKVNERAMESIEHPPITFPQLTAID